MSGLKKAALVAVALIICLGAMSVLTSNQGDEDPEDLAPPESPEPTGSEPGGEPQGSEDVVPVVGEEERERLIPEDAVKVTPETDPFPPILHHPLWGEPEPMPYPINTAGAEDSPFITPCGCTFYFWYTPIACSSLEGQINDGVTGIWYSTKTTSAASDHWPFYMQGVPTVTMGSEPSPQQLIVGRGWGHTTADMMDKVDPRNMQEGVMVLARLILRVANQEEKIAEHTPLEDIIAHLEKTKMKRTLEVEKKWHPHSVR